MILTEKLINDDKTGPESGLHGFRTRSQAPTILYVHRESYQVASKTFSRVFGTDISFPETWFNFAVDTLVLDWGWRYASDYEPNDFTREDLDKIHFLTLKESELFLKALATNAEKNG